MEIHLVAVHDLFDPFSQSSFPKWKPFFFLYKCWQLKEDFIAEKSDK